MPRRERPRRPARRPAFRLQKPVILIVCEGAATEPQYLRGHANSCRNPRVEIEIAKEHGDPKYLVETAKRLRKENQKAAKQEKDENVLYDEVWCVFDVDDHERFAEARQMAHDNKLELAVSNPCFELWLLLHFRESPGLQHRDVVRRMLKEHVPEYDKKVDHRAFRSGYQSAETRAKRLDAQAVEAGESGRNPTTSVYRLTRSISTG